MPEIRRTWLRRKNLLWERPAPRCAGDTSPSANASLVQRGGRAWGHPSQSGFFRIASRRCCFGAKGSDEAGGTVETLPFLFATSSFRARSVFAFCYRVPRVDGAVRCSARLRCSSVVLADGSTVLPADETAALLSIVPGGSRKGSDETGGAVETVECCLVCCIRRSP